MNRMVNSLKNRMALNALIIFLLSALLNWLSVMLAPLASPDDLGQLAFVLVVFFPAVAFIAGVLSRRLRLHILAAVSIAAVSAAAVIFLMYSSTNFVYVLTCAAVSAAGYLVSLAVELLIKRLRKNKNGR